MKYFPIVMILLSAVLWFAVLDAKASEVSHSVTTLSSSRDDFDRLLAEALKYYREQKWQDLIAVGEKMVKLRPEDNRGYAMSAAGYLALWKMDEASALLALAIRFSPGNPVLHYHKARADRFRNARDEGLVSVRKAIELKPGYAEAYLLLGDLLTKEDEKINAYRKAIEIDPKLVDAYRYLGMELERRKDEKTAEEVYRTALQIDPKRASGFYDLGRLMVKQKRLREARELWEKRPEVEDNTFPNFISLLERAETLETATAAYAKNPKDAEANLLMGLATMDGDHWVVDGRQEKAIVFFRKALEARPDFAKAQYAICKAYVQIADTYTKKNKELDQELAKLRKMDEKLASEIVEYRKTYEGGLKGVPAGPPPPAKHP